MAAVGSITLDSREYQLVDPTRLVRSNANQVAAKIGSSAGDYDDLQNWSAWVMDDWRAGVGEKDPESGGFLYASAETRYENQLLLPLHKQHVSNATTPYGQVSIGEIGLISTSTNAGSLTTIGSGQAYTKLADRLLVTGGYTLSHIDLFLPGKPTTATQFTVEIWSDNTTSPNALLQSTTVTLNGELGHSWYSVDISDLSPGVNTFYWLVVYPTTSTATLLTAGASSWGYNGSAWASNAPGFAAFYHINVNVVDAAITHMVEFNSRAYIAAGTKLYKIADTDGIDHIRTCGATITDLLAIGDTLYIGLGDSTNYDTMNTSEVFAAGLVPARLLALHNGYLWRAVGRELHYTSDEVTWTTITPTVADAGFLIRGLAGFQTDMLASTDNALYRIAPGDNLYVVSRWGTIDSTNGKYMLNFQGNLYISQGKSLLRYDGASLLPMGIDLGEGLPHARYGNVVGLSANNNWLVLGIAGENYSTCWAHNGQGWHFLAELPKGVTLSAIRYVGAGRGSNTGYLNRLLMGTTTAPVYRVSLPDTARSTLKLAEEENDYYFELCGTLETDWFYGSLREVRKDFESIYGDGENLDSNRYVDMYWQDEDSTNWESLSTIDSTGEELRWSNYNTRPNSRRIKLKLVIITKKYFYTPVINAMRVKYMPMVTDRWRWQVPIMVAPALETPNNDLLDTYTVAQQITHLDTLINQVPPFIFKDTDGSQYEVKITNATRQVQEFDYFNAAKQVKYIYNLTLEQVTAGTYSG